MKQIILKTQFVIGILFISMTIHSQTVSIDDFVYSSTEVGTTVLIPLNSTDITANYGNIIIGTIGVTFDTEVLTYVGYTNLNVNFPPINLSVNPDGSAGFVQYNIEDQAFAGFPWPDGKILDMQFIFNGGQTDLLIDPAEFLNDGFATENANVDDGSAEGFYDNVIVGGAWATSSNWSALKVSDAWANVTVAAGTETTIATAATSNNLTIEQGGELTLNDALTIGGDFLIESTATGNGSFIDNGTLAAGTSSVQSYVTAGQWHGIASPIAGLTANALYLNDNPTVWLRSYNENDDTYTNITSLTTELGDMEGWMTWVGGTTNHLYTFTGDLKNGAFSKNMEFAGYGYNFVGNPYSSAIDWDATGWTKTNVNNATYVYNNGNWATYIAGASLNGGSQYIAMNQGFFVQANALAGVLSMTNDVCVHNGVPFMKNQMDAGEIIRLQIEDGELSDESVIRFIDGATTEFDGDFDAHKLFSFNDDYPQLYSTANDFMAINSLPMDYTDAIPMDVRGADGNTMTISANEAEGFDNVYLKDEFTGNLTDLKIESYTFTYNAEITNRFTILRSITGVDEDPISNEDVKIFAYNKNIHVVTNAQSSANITVYNLMGQEIASQLANSTVTLVPVVKSGFYVVKVSDGKYVSSQKVYIK